MPIKSKQKITGHYLAAMLNGILMAINYVAFHGWHIHGFLMGHPWHINRLFCSSARVDQLSQYLDGEVMAEEIS